MSAVPNTQSSRRPLAMLLGAVLLGFAGSAHAQARGADLKGAAARLDALLARYHDVGQFNGTALVAFQGRVVLDAGYGLADFEFGVPNGPHTKQWLGSVSKVLTATTVMRLVDEGKLSLDTTVAELLPWYRKDTGSKVTVRELLNHTSGIPDYMHLPGIGREGFRREVGDSVIDVEAFAKKWCSGDLQWEPGSKWGYSNSGYVLLGAIVERLTGGPFARALEALVLRPAGMKDTEDLAMRPRAMVKDLTPGYEKLAGMIIARRPWNLSTTFAAGSVVATVRDLYRFDEALYRDDFVSPAARAAMFTEGMGHYGCGWEVTTAPIGPAREERTIAGHEGFIFWSLARIYRIEKDHAFVALINNTGDAPLQAIFAGIADVLYGRQPVWPKPSAAEAVHALALERGGEAAVARYRELEATQADDYVFDERGLNSLGYALMQEGDPKAAVAIFQLMVETYPTSANALDSLGEALAAAGRRDEAVKAYARSLQLDPGNANAVAQLARLVAR